MNPTAVTVICPGKKQVAMTPRACKTWEGVDPERKAVVMRVMQHLVGDAIDIPKDHFRHEARITVSGKKIAVFAIKAHQLRLYGSWLQGMFVVVEIDSAKKQDKADPGFLERAAKALASLQAQG